MKIKIIGVEEEIDRKCKYGPELGDINWESHSAINRKTKKQVEEQYSLFGEMLNQAMGLQSGNKKWEKLNYNGKLDLNRWFSIKSTSTDELFSWGFLENLYALKTKNY